MNNDITIEEYILSAKQFIDTMSSAITELETKKDAISSSRLKLIELKKARSEMYVKMIDVKKKLRNAQDEFNRLTLEVGVLEEEILQNSLNEENEETLVYQNENDIVALDMQLFNQLHEISVLTLCIPGLIQQGVQSSFDVESTRLIISDFIKEDDNLVSMIDNLQKIDDKYQALYEEIKENIEEVNSKIAS